MPNYTMPYTKETFESAMKGINGMPPASSIALLDANSVVKASQARALVRQINASYVLGEADAETLALLYNATPLVVTLPGPATYNFPVGTAFSFIRWGAGAVNFALGAGMSWQVADALTYITATGKSAVAIKVTTDSWWLSCG